jgi:hypothetical protein
MRDVVVDGGSRSLPVAVVVNNDTPPPGTTLGR